MAAGLIILCSCHTMTSRSSIPSLGFGGLQAPLGQHCLQHLSLCQLFALRSTSRYVPSSWSLTWITSLKATGGYMWLVETPCPNHIYTNTHWLLLLLGMLGIKVISCIVLKGNNRYLHRKCNTGSAKWIRQGVQHSSDPTRPAASMIKLWTSEASAGYPRVFAFMRHFEHGELARACSNKLRPVF